MTLPVRRNGLKDLVGTVFREKSSLQSLCFYSNFVCILWVNGCATQSCSTGPDFVVLSLEYEVISTAKGPDGEQVSILTTNHTHTAVENLRPESRYDQHRVHRRISPDHESASDLIRPS